MIYISVFCILCEEKGNVWVISKCVIPVQSSQSFIALNLFYILPCKVVRIEEFGKREGGVFVSCFGGLRLGCNLVELWDQ